MTPSPQPLPHKSKSDYDFSVVGTFPVESNITAHLYSAKDCSSLDGKNSYFKILIHTCFFPLYEFLIKDKNCS